jgi:hypothetical protein
MIKFSLNALFQQTDEETVSMINEHKTQIESLTSRLVDALLDMDVLCLERDWFAEELDKCNKPPISDIFWDKGNSEELYHDVRDIFENAIDSDTKVGLEITVLEAMSMPTLTYRLTELNDDCSFEIEEIT